MPRYLYLLLYKRKTPKCQFLLFISTKAHVPGFCYFLFLPQLNGEDVLTQRTVVKEEEEDEEEATVNIAR